MRQRLHWLAVTHREPRVGRERRTAIRHRHDRTVRQPPSESGPSAFLSLERARRAGSAAQMSGSLSLSGPSRPSRQTTQAKHRLRRLTRRTERGHRQAALATPPGACRQSIQPRTTPPMTEPCASPPASPAALSSFHLKEHGGREAPRRCPGRSPSAALSGPSRPSRQTTQAKYRLRRLTRRTERGHHTEQPSACPKQPPPGPGQTQKTVPHNGRTGKESAMFHHRE